MELKLSHKGNILIVSIEGEIDHHSSEIIRNKVDSKITTATIKNLVFDFSRVSFMDSSGIGMLMGRYKNVMRIGGKVWLMSASGTVKRILEMSGVLKVIPTIASLEDVVKKVL